MQKLEEQYTEGMIIGFQYKDGNIPAKRIVEQFGTGTIISSIISGVFYAEGNKDVFENVIRFYLTNEAWIPYKFNNHYKRSEWFLGNNSHTIII